MMKVISLFFTVMALSISIDAIQLRGVNRKLRQAQQSLIPTQQSFICGGNRRQLMGGKAGNTLAPVVMEDLSVTYKPRYVLIFRKP